MKKFITVMLILLCAMSFVACKKTDNDSVEEPIVAIEETATPVAE